MSLEDQTIDDYVPQPARKRRISRGRKALIGLMAIGAFAATQGAGTFASFTASTDNAGSEDSAGDNPFQTGNFELLNTVMDSSGATADWVLYDPNCSSVDEDETTGDLADDNHAECDVLFDGEANDVIGGITTYVKIENASATDGSGDGELVFYAPSVCDQGTLGSADNCDDVLITVQEIADGGVPGAGATTPGLTATPNIVSECVFGRVDTDAGVPYVGANSDDDADVASGTQDQCTYGRPLSALPTLASRVTIASDFPAAKTTGNEDVRYFRIHAQLPDSVAACGAITEPAYTGLNNTGGFNTTTGIGCHNGFDDTSSVFKVRWMLIA